MDEQEKNRVYRIIELNEHFEPHIKSIRAEIFRLAKQAPDLDVIHWYMWLDACFENNEFSPDDFSKVQWRSMALQGKGEPIYRLFSMITPVLQAFGLVDENGRPIERETPLSGDGLGK